MENTVKNNFNGKTPVGDGVVKPHGEGVKSNGAPSGGGRNPSGVDGEKKKPNKRKRRYYGKKKAGANNGVKPRTPASSSGKSKNVGATVGGGGSPLINKSSKPNIIEAKDESTSGNAPRMNNSELSIVQVLQDTPGSIFIYTSHRGIITKLMLDENYELVDMSNGGYFTEYVPEDAYDFVWVGKRRL